ncbi:hypothetical protein [Vibrio navarrensis]|uniref:hypothetical protein n=1 Tax=Vibrio navarrensis TaxID=29495 RepID=UPI00051D27D8|nr:hypothetical protein [Vibrio navarrensis]KGK09583.1 hypothetical protein EA24_02385 [Vibrio navarrensis]
MKLKLDYSDLGIILVAVLSVGLAIKESSIPFWNIVSENSLIVCLFKQSDASGLIFNVSCGAIATFIFWVIDIFIPKQRKFSHLRKYFPQWRQYLSDHYKELNSILHAMGERRNGEPTRITIGSTAGIHDSIDFGVQFDKVDKSRVQYSIEAIAMIVKDIRNYEQALTKEELSLIHEVNVELVKYQAFISNRESLGSNKDFNHLKLIRSKINSILNSDMFGAK